MVLLNEVKNTGLSQKDETGIRFRLMAEESTALTGYSTNNYPLWLEEAQEIFSIYCLTGHHFGVK